LGESINLQKVREAYPGTVSVGSLSEVFIRKGEYAYVYVQNYGEVAFSNCDENTIKEFIASVLPFVDSPALPGKEYKEDFIISVAPGQSLSFEYNSIQVPDINADVIKIVMLNVNQSVVLDYFTELCQNILYETTRYTHELELRGKVGISKTKLMKLIGKTLNIQNRITDNLYFLDAPDTVWDMEHLSEINAGLSKTFNLKTRFREVEYTLKIIENNQRTFAQLVQHRDANKLEWIIILLIFLEVVNTLIGKYVFN